MGRGGSMLLETLKGKMVLRFGVLYIPSYSQINMVFEIVYIGQNEEVSYFMLILKDRASS